MFIKYIFATEQNKRISSLTNPLFVSTIHNMNSFCTASSLLIFAVERYLAHSKEHNKPAGTSTIWLASEPPSLNLEMSGDLQGRKYQNVVHVCYKVHARTCMYLNLLHCCDWPCMSSTKRTATRKCLRQSFLWSVLKCALGKTPRVDKTSFVTRNLTVAKTVSALKKMVLFHPLSSVW